MDREVVNYMKLWCGRSVVQVLVVRVDIREVTYEAMTPSVGGQWFSSWLSEWI